jgi:SAM-dependent methyltransferase
MRRFGFLGQEWDKGLAEELQAWEFMLTDQGRNWTVSEYQYRLDPEAELQDEYKQLIDVAPGDPPIRLLDVGAGPLTSFGKRWKGRTLQIFPVDPLAKEYNALLTRLGLHSPAPSQLGHGEKLPEMFEKNFFDLALASNSLDHSYDPLLVIYHMLTVVKPGCQVFLGHFINEAVAAGYTGLHQWNFSLKHGDMILSDGRKRYHSLREEFKDLATMECEAQEWVGRPAVIGRLKKLRAS